ncbi:hypothetical protein ACTG9Q_10025 [Actinokineospora sp. 24-640]
MTEITDSATLAGRDIDGRPSRFEVKGDQMVAVPGSALDTQRVRTADGTVLIRRSLRAGTARTALDNEICALARLNRAFRDEGRPFPQLLAYDVDSTDPWALVTEYRGAPARTAVDSLLRPGLLDLTIGVFDALAHLASVELTHNGLDLGVVHLSGSSVQITTFEHAALVGERTARGGVAGPQDDLPDAGRLVYEAYTGVRSEQPDLQDVAGLQGYLAGIFDEPRRRPPAAEVLRRFGRAAAPRDPTRAELERGRAAFDAARKRKLPPEPPTLRTQPAQQNKKTTRKPGWLLLAVGLALLISVIVFGVVQVVS